MDKKINVVLLVLFLASLLVITRLALAETFSLSYSLTEGGYQLELTPQNQYKGVEIRVTTDVAARYEIVQRILSPLESRESPGTIIRENFTMRGIRSSSKGTLHVPTNDMFVRQEERLYTSNAAGAQDNITIVYGLLNIDRILPGHYHGRISYTLQPIGSNRSPQTKYLDIYVTVSQEVQAKPSIELATSSGSKVIILDSKNEETQTADVIVRINSAFSNLFSISQAVNRPLESADGNQLEYKAVNFVVRQAQKGTSTNQAMPLSSQLQSLYTSTSSGDADESFIISYSLGDLSDQKAGRYSTNIQYFLEGVGGLKKSLGTLQLEVENERVFALAIKPQDEKGIIEFRNLKAQEGPKTNEVIIEIKTNIGRQYQVSQNVYSELTEKGGGVIPNKYFTLKTDSLDTKGILKFPQKQEIKTGETVLLISDESGSSDNFKVIYELVPQEDMKAGNYSTRITYSLSEI